LQLIQHSGKKYQQLNNLPLATGQLESLEVPEFFSMALFLAGFMSYPA
jgi:hypothetical protein